VLIDAIPVGALVFDCRHRLGDPDLGREAFAAGHIPGARHLHLDDDLSGPRRADRIGGRHPLPDPKIFADRLAAHGLSDGQLVVAYDDIGGAFAARLWWMLRWMGHDAVGVLNGGLDAWPGHLETGPAAASVRGTFRARMRPEWVATRNDVAASKLLIDARAAARYRGEHEPHDPVAGHIPGALSRPWTDALVDGRLQTPPEVPPGPGIAYCGSGVTACVNLLLLSVSGRQDIRLYPGSWGDWLAAGGAVETGEGR
jgi:thiosulfate/3-mercaptopyruvate sulfurtransferase